MPPRRASKRASNPPNLKEPDGEEENENEEEEEEEETRPVKWQKKKVKADTPPAHNIFAKDKADHIASPTVTPSILQRRVAASHSQANSAAPVINIHFTLPDALLPAPTAMPAPAPAPMLADPAKEALVPPNTTVSKSMLISEFCAQHTVEESIPQKLEKNERAAGNDLNRIARGVLAGKSGLWNPLRFWASNIQNRTGVVTGNSIYLAIGLGKLYRELFHFLLYGGLRERQPF
ncbi:hypothetical protein C8F04DRAFT_1202839 [Mycena alexandri]|uniref:Uncharacterized protein n=1 Tax=Mycena alexandri TaxID=1745969 RepID=A0AAD6RZS9_9AGAR|nr:hypothetical protein C8F04DRAFT_1202839 [Mycena alexandri]